MSSPPPTRIVEERLAKRTSTPYAKSVPPPALSTPAPSAIAPTQFPPSSSPSEWPAAAPPPAAIPASPPLSVASPSATASASHEPSPVHASTPFPAVESFSSSAAAASQLHAQPSGPPAQTSTPGRYVAGQVRVEGMTCDACVNSIMRVLTEKYGVVDGAAGTRTCTLLTVLFSPRVSFSSKPMFNIQYITL